MGRVLSVVHASATSHHSNHKWSQLNCFPLSTCFIWGPWEYDFFLWGKEGRGGMAAVRGTQSISHHAAVQDPGSVREHHGPRKRLQEGPHRQVAVQICSVVTSMDGERRLSSFPGYITAPCHPGPRPTPLTQKYRYVMSTADFNGFPLNLRYGYILLLTTYIPTLLTY